MAAKRKNEKKKLQKNRQPEFSGRFSLWVVYAYLFTGIIFTGAYYSEMLALAGSLLLGAVLTADLFRKRRETFFGIPEIVFLVFLAWAGVVSFWAVSISDHLVLLPVLAVSFLVFVRVRHENLFGSARPAEGISDVLYASSLVSVFLGLAVKTFGHNIFYTYFVSNRFFGSFGYPNTAAVIFLVTFFYGLTLLPQKVFFEKKKYLLYFFNSLILIFFVLTFSRGAMAVFPFLIILMLVSVSREERKRIAVQFLKAALPAAAVSPFFIRLFAEGESSPYAVAGTAVLFLLALSVDRAGEILEKNRILLIGIPTAVLAGLVFFFAKAGEGAALLGRLARIDFSSSSFLDRFTFISDGLRIFMENPAGIGLNGWDSLYRMYQSYGYHTKYVHSHPVQVLVELGAVGFLLFAVLVLWGPTRSFLENLRGKDTRRAYLLTAFAALFVHSWIDFDLSYPAVHILFWIFTAFLYEKKPARQRAFFSGAVSVLGVAAVIVSCWLLVAFQLSSAGEQALIRGDLPEAEKNFLEANIIFPYNSYNYANLAQVYNYRGEDTERASALAKARELEPYNFEWPLLEFRYLAEEGNYEEAWSVFGEARELALFERLLYQDAMEIFMLDSDNPEALKYAVETGRLALDAHESIENEKYREENVNKTFTSRVSRPYEKALEMLEEATKAY